MTAGNSGMLNISTCNSFSKKKLQYKIRIPVTNHTCTCTVYSPMFMASVVSSQSVCMHYFSLLISANFCVCYFYMTLKLVFDCIVFPCLFQQCIPQ